MGGRPHTWFLLAMTWHPSNPEDLATLLTVKFEEIDEGRTRLVLVHDGWQVRGDAAQQLRDGYARGWDGVLAAYKKNSR